MRACEPQLERSPFLLQLEKKPVCSNKCPVQPTNQTNPLKPLSWVKFLPAFHSFGLPQPFAALFSGLVGFPAGLPQWPVSL